MRPNAGKDARLNMQQEIPKRAISIQITNGDDRHKLMTALERK